MMKFKKSVFRIHLILINFLFSSMFTSAQYDSIYFDGLHRTYLLHLPTGYSANNVYPLVIAMHGGFGNSFNLQNQSQLSVKAEAESFIVVYPEGVKGGLLDIRTWNAGWCCGYASNSNTDDVGFINALLDTMIFRFAIDTTRIYATGMSNGGFMSYRLACELSGRIAAIAPVAASMSMTDCAPDKQVPVIHFHSYLDSSVLYYGGTGTGISNHYNPPLDSVLNVWAKNNGCSVINDTLIHDTQYTFTKWISCECGSEIHYYITQDGGHSWPGGNQTPVGDPPSAFINATDLMWSFFQQHSLRCKTSGLIEASVDIGFEFFPNPTSGILNIIIPESVKDFSITIFNTSGQIVFLTQNTKVIKLTSQPKGIYYMSIRTKDHTVMKKIIITD